MEMKNTNAGNNSPGTKPKPIADKFKAGPDNMKRQIHPEDQERLNYEFFHASLERGEKGTKLVKEALDKGADVNFTHNEGKMTALMRAAMWNDFEMAKALIAAGADLDAKDWESKTALMYAKTLMRHEMVKFLREAGAKE